VAVIDPAKGPEPVILADLHYERDLYDEVGPRRYPFRSADYDFAEKRIAGMALLVRRPFLDLGMLPYQHRARIVQYAMETPMAEPAEFTPDEEAQYAKICRYFKAKYPKMAAYMDGDAALGAGAAATPGLPPAQYAALEATNRDLLKKLAQGDCERLLDKVTAVKFDRDRELKVLLSLAEADRPAHVQYMLDTYQKLPTTTPEVRVAGGAAGSGAGGGAGGPQVPAAQQAMTMNQMEAAVQYAASQKVPFETARQWALANVKAAS
jgi:hypothetical protein